MYRVHTFSGGIDIDIVRPYRLNTHTPRYVRYQKLPSSRAKQLGGVNHPLPLNLSFGEIPRFDFRGGILTRDWLEMLPACIETKLEAWVTGIYKPITEPCFSMYIES
jgi:hypothetical protein